MNELTEAMAGLWQATFSTRFVCVLSAIRKNSPSAQTIRSVAETNTNLITKASPLSLHLCHSSFQQTAQAAPFFIVLGLQPSAWSHSQYPFRYRKPEATHFSNSLLISIHCSSFKAWGCVQRGERLTVPPLCSSLFFSTLSSRHPKA